METNKKDKYHLRQGGRVSRQSSCRSGLWSRKTKDSTDFMDFRCRRHDFMDLMDWGNRVKNAFALIGYQ